jgi:hypothetical protein
VKALLQNFKWAVSILAGVACMFVLGACLVIPGISGNPGAYAITIPLAVATLMIMKQLMEWGVGDD